jgi:hypothetical protein
MARFCNNIENTIYEQNIYFELAMEAIYPSLI